MTGKNRSSNSMFGAMRASLLGFSCLTAIGAIALPSAVSAQEAAQKVNIDIPEQSMADALNAFALQVKKQIVFYSNDAARLRSGPIKGTFSEAEALKTILGDSGLEFIYVNNRTIGIGRRDSRGRFIVTSADGGEVLAADDVIMVTGRLLDAQLSSEAKRNADQIVDVLTSDQASQLPDQNVAESLSRIPGVSLIRSNETGDGNYISIRGLDSALSNIQFDGVNSGQTGGARRYTPNRSVPLEGITAENIKEIRVAKSLLPQDEGVGIGGAVNIIPRTPLDGDKDHLNVNASARYGEFAGKIGFDGGFNFTKIFSDSFGVNLAGSFRRRNIRNYQTEVGETVLGYIDSLEDAAGNTLTGAELLALGLDAQNDYKDFEPGYFSADQIIFDAHDYQVQEQIRDTYSLSGAIDWRASDTTLFTLSGRYSRTEIDGKEWQLQFDQDKRGFTLDGDRAVAIFGDLELDYQAQLEQSIDTSASILLKGVTETDKWLLKYQGSYSKSKTANPQSDLVFDSGSEYDDADDNLNYMAYNYTNTYFPVPNTSILQNPAFKAALLDPAADALVIDPFGLRIYQIDISNDRYAGKFDVTYKAEADLLGGYLNSITFGAKAERSEAVSFFDYYSFGTAGLNLDGSYSAGAGDAGGQPLSAFTTLDTGGSVSLSPIDGPLVPIGINSIITFDNDGFEQFIGNYRRSFLESGDPFVFELSFDGQEDIYAGYAQFDWESGPFRLIAGARVERYEGKFIAPLSAQGQVTLVTDGVDDVTGDPIDDRGISLTTPGVTLPFVTTRAGNTEFLPRMAASFDVTDRFKVRLGAGYSLARPSYNQLGAATRLNISVEAEEVGGVILPGIEDDIDAAIAAGGLDPSQINEVSVSVSSGNSDLKNSRSLNLDLSFEYYPITGTSVTLGLFYKEIKNFIFVGSESDDNGVDIAFVESLLEPQALELLASIGGVAALIDDTYTTTLSISRPQNGTTATLKGLEFGVNHRFDWAPGFLQHVGFTGNVTYTDSEAEFIIEESLGADTALVTLGYAAEGDTLTRVSTFFRAPEISANASFYYDDGAFDAALSMSYQSESFSSGGDFGLDNFNGAYTQLDLFVGYDLPFASGDMKVFAEVADLLDSGVKATGIDTIGRSRTAFSDANFNGREFRVGFRGRF